jgi:hypothetical protein
VYFLSIKNSLFSVKQVNRPLSMKKDGIQTRKRKPKTPGKSKSPSKDHIHNNSQAPEPTLAPPMYTPPQVTSAYHTPPQPSQGLLDLSVARSDPSDNHPTGAPYISFPPSLKIVDTYRKVMIPNRFPLQRQSL